MSLPGLHLNLRAQLLLGFGVVLTISAAVSALAYRNTLDYTGAALLVRHTEQVIAAAEAAHLTIADLSNNYHEYLLTGSESALNAYRADTANYHTQLKDLAALTADDPAQVARWRAIEGSVDQWRAGLLEPGIAMRQQMPPGVPATADLLRFDPSGEQQSAFADVGVAFDQAIAVEDELFIERSLAVGAGNQFLLGAIAAGTVITILLGIVVAVWLSARMGDGMERLAEGARAIAAGDLGRRINVRRSDEIGEVAVAFDLMAAALQQDRAEREAVERLKDEFVSVVSHELRTPLTSIRGSLGLLHAGLLGPISPKAERMLDVALSNTDRLIRLINDILDIERMRSGRVPMQMEPADARELVHRSVESVRGLADGARVELVEDAEQIELTVDPDRIVQTLTNLISNAIKFSPPDARIDVHARRTDAEAVFRVTDRGRGIPPDKLEKIFGRFEQVDTSDARDKGGTGLGLAISRSIVQLHGGRIWVESTLGEGSTFSFTLPLPAPSAALPTVAADSVRLAPHILVVDDDPNVIEVVGHMLAREGYEPVGARSGDEALAIARSEAPAAILLDVAMPAMSGWEVLSQLKADDATRDIPVVILSGLERVRDEQTEESQGWISKPVTPDALRAMVDRVTTPQGEPGRVLIVEDDQDLARVLSESFNQRGMRTQSAASSRQAISFCAANPPDVLLLDLALSDGDGFEVVDWFREHDRLRRVPIVVYTARDLSVSERDRLQLGHTEFVTKGRLSPEDVQRRVLRLVQRVVPAGEQRAA